MLTPIDINNMLSCSCNTGPLLPGDARGSGIKVKNSRCRIGHNVKIQTVSARYKKLKYPCTCGPVGRRRRARGEMLLYKSMQLHLLANVYTLPQNYTLYNSDKYRNSRVHNTVYGDTALFILATMSEVLYTAKRHTKHFTKQLMFTYDK